MPKFNVRFKYEAVVTSEVDATTFEEALKKGRELANCAEDMVRRKSGYSIEDAWALFKGVTRY